MLCGLENFEGELRIWLWRNLENGIVRSRNWQYVTKWKPAIPDQIMKIFFFYYIISRPAACVYAPPPRYSYNKLKKKETETNSVYVYVLYIPISVLSDTQVQRAFYINLKLVRNRFPSTYIISLLPTKKKNAKKSSNRIIMRLIFLSLEFQNLSSWTLIILL